MANIFEQDFLQTCSKCLKFLNVKPIKKFGDGSLRCGRCTQVGDGGLLTKHNNFGENQLFKCINKFDGCRVLLNSSQIVDHETICVSKLHNCPNCPPDVFVPTYQLEEHFKQKHYLCLLKSNTIVVRDKLIVHNLLYKHEDHLFVINMEINPFIKLVQTRGIPIGAPEGTRVNFEIKMACEQIHPNHIMTPYESENYRFQRMDDPAKVTITIIPEVITVLYRPLVIEGGDNNPNPVVDPSEILAEKEILQRFNFFSDVCLKSTIYWPPAIDQSSLPQDFILGVDSTHLIKVKTTRNTKVYLHCYNCFNKSFGATLLGGFVKINNNQFFLCDICYNLEKIRNKFIKTGVFRRIYRSLYFNYKCLYNCSYNLENTHAHSYMCEDQPNFQCPIKDCDISAHLDKLFVHLYDVHEILTENYLIWNISLYPDLHNKGTVIERYVWVMPYFIKITFSAQSRFWRIQIGFPTKYKVPENLTVKALLFAQNDKMLDIVTQDCDVNLVPTNNITVHCLFEKNNNDDTIIKYGHNE